LPHDATQECPLALSPAAPLRPVGEQQATAGSMTMRAGPKSCFLFVELNKH
jgi:hypothetical protein